MLVVCKMIKTLELFDGLKVKVSSNGEIETFDKIAIRKNGRPDNRKGKVLKPKVDRYGYKVVTLSKNGKRKSYLVHRLVAMAFIDNPLQKETVNHIDGNKLNNSAENLEWATQKEQKVHAIEMGLASKNIDALKEANTKRSIPIYFRGKHYPSINSAARENNVHVRVVRREGDANE